MSKFYILGKEIIGMSVLKTWATPRLLRYYKEMRRHTNRPTESLYDSQARRDFPILQAYVDNIRALLNSREHVPVSPKLGKRQKAARAKLIAAREKYKLR